MSLAEIEAALENLTSEELRQLALKSWHAFAEREQTNPSECDENDPELLAALSEALSKADASAGKGHSGNDLRIRLNEWTSK